MVICKECNKVFETLDSLRRHRSQKHSINAEQTYVDYNLNGIKPKCKCGCGEKPKYLGIDVGYREYKHGHGARVSNNWGHNSNALKKSHETQKKMHDDGTLKVWNDGLTMEDERVRDNITKVMANTERGINISKALSDKPKSTEHKANISKSAIVRWDSKEERNKQSLSVISRLIKNNYRNKKTKLEIKFEGILEELGVKFKYQHQVSSAIFDFLIIDTKIIIEVDGYFHHCNPNTIHKIPIFPIQIKTVGNDFRKNLIAEDNGYKLLRFWETDINKHPEDVINQLKQELNNGK